MSYLLWTILLVVSGNQSRLSIWSRFCLVFILQLFDLIHRLQIKWQPHWINKRVWKFATINISAENFPDSIQTFLKMHY